MNSKERIKTIVEGRKPDRPPVICPGGMMNMITTELLEKGGFVFNEVHTDPEKMAALSEFAYRNKCFENVGVPFCMTAEVEALGAGVDMGCNNREPRVVRYPLTSLEEWEKVPCFDVSKGRFQVIKEAINILSNRLSDVPVIGNVTGPVSAATSLIDPSVFYVGLRKKGQMAHALLNHVTNEMLKYIELMIDAGADIIMIADPSATGEILGPKFFEEFAVPYINRMVDCIRRKGKISIVHICGQMTPVLDKANAITADILSFDAIVAMNDIRKAMGNRAIMGNVSTYAIEDAEADRIIELTRNAVKQGFDVISPACGLGMSSPLCNIAAMIDALEE